MNYKPIVGPYRRPCTPEARGGRCWCAPRSANVLSKYVYPPAFTKNHVDGAACTVVVVVHTVGLSLWCWLATAWSLLAAFRSGFGTRFLRALLLLLLRNLGETLLDPRTVVLHLDGKRALVSHWRTELPGDGFPLLLVRPWTEGRFRARRGDGVNNVDRAISLRPLERWRWRWWFSFFLPHNARGTSGAEARAALLCRGADLVGVSRVGTPIGQLRYFKLTTYVVISGEKL